MIMIGAAPAASTSRAPLDTLWEGYMLQGVDAIVFVDQAGTTKGPVEPDVPTQSFTEAKGNPRWAWSLKYGISVRGPMETRALGFWRKGGWLLSGGLLARAEEPTELIECYGKFVEWTAPYFPFPFHRLPPERWWSYEFFLLQRERRTMSTRLIHKWVFEPPQLAPSSREPEDDSVRAELAYQPGTRTATVIVHGLARPFQENVQIPPLKP